MPAKARKTAKPSRPPTRTEEEQAYVASLERCGQAAPGGGPLPPGATHRLVVTRSGAKRVKRKRYSAV